MVRSILFVKVWNKGILNLLWMVQSTLIFLIMIDCSPCCASSGHLRSFKLLPGCCRPSSLLRILGTYSVFYSNAFMSEKFLLSCFVYYETYLIALKMAVDFFLFPRCFLHSEFVFRHEWHLVYVVTVFFFCSNTTSSGCVKWLFHFFPCEVM